MMSLNEAVLLSLRYNPNVESGEIQRVIDKFDLRVANYAFEWQYALTGSAVYSYTKSSGIGTSSKALNLSPQASLLTSTGMQITANANTLKTHYFNPGVAVTVVQPLLNGAGPSVVLAPLYNAEDQEIINKLTLYNNVMQTITSVITAYRALVEAKNNLTTSQISLESYQETVKQDQALIQAGRMAPSDIVQAQAQIATQQVAVQEAINGVTQAKQQLLITIGLDPNTPIDVPENIEIDNQPIPDQKQSIALALANDPTYQTQLLQLNILRRNVLVAKNQQLPTVNLVGTAAVGNGSGGGINAGVNSLINGSNSANSIGVQLSVPIDNLPIQQQLVDARIALDQANIQLLSLQRQITSNVINAIQNIEITLEQAKLSEQAQLLNKQTLDIAQAKQKYGRSSTFEVVTVTGNYNSALLEATADKINYLNALTNFDQIVGTTVQKWHIIIRY